MMWNYVTASEMNSVPEAKVTKITVKKSHLKHHVLKEPTGHPPKGHRDNMDIQVGYRISSKILVNSSKILVKFS